MNVIWDFILKMETKQLVVEQELQKGMSFVTIMHIDALG